MDLDLMRVIIDFGLVVLIWIVQLIIYPSFKYYNDDGLQHWHSINTIRIAVVVIPLMLAQLAIYGIQCLAHQTVFEITGIVLVLIMWAFTFKSFVPLHNAIALGKSTGQTLTQLVRYNWARTLIWSILCILSFWNYMQSY